jgi:hypothetical protein
MPQVMSLENLCASAEDYMRAIDPQLDEMPTSISIDLYGEDDDEGFDAWLSVVRQCRKRGGRAA